MLQLQNGIYFGRKTGAEKPTDIVGINVVVTYIQ